MAARSVHRRVRARAEVFQLTVDRYLRTRYVPGGRGPDEFDCWGLVRDARQQLFGLPLLPSYGAITPDDKAGLTRACTDTVLQYLEPCKPARAAIATAWRARLCVHVGLVVQADGRLWVLETDTPGGPCLTPLRLFENRYLRVIYYADKSFPVDIAG